jgi:cation transport protein ChaC
VARPRCRDWCSASTAAEVIDYLFEREMVTGVYHPCWRRAETHDGAVIAMTFVVDRGHGQYAGNLDHDAMVALILQGRGHRGPCLEYLENTVHHLRALGLKDRALERLLTEAQRLREEGKTT